MIPAGKYEIKVNRISEVWPLYTIGDCHLGSAGCSVEHLAEDVERVRTNPCARAILMGDLADFVGPADKRWDPANVTPEATVKDLADWGKYLARMVVKVFKPIRHQIIGALYGNHEDTYETRHAQQLHDWTCEELGIPNLGYSCFVDIVFRRSLKSARASSPQARSYRVAADHGSSSAGSDGGKINKLVSFMNNREADIYIMGHLHEKDCKPLDRLAANDKCDKIISKKRLGLFSGTYLKTYYETKRAGYGERRGYRPVSLGCSVLEFQPFGHDWVHRGESVSARVAI